MCIRDSLEANQTNAYLGGPVAAAGDVNGDGFADVIVGAFRYNSGEDNEGAAFVFHGSAAGITGAGPDDADATIEGDQAGAGLGYNLGVAGAGDVNGDGYDDVIVGAFYYDNDETDEGAAFIFHGSAAGITGTGPADADAMIESDQTDAVLGGSVAGAGDVNGDGFADVIVGAQSYDNVETDEGAAFVFQGSASGVVASGTPANADATIEANQAGANLGYCVATAGDVDGDGFSDVVVGAVYYDNVETDEGAALVFHGSAAGITGTCPADADALIESDLSLIHI